jgi:flagellar basal body rod protein FlgG
MLRALYSAGWAMSANLDAHEVIAHNVANVDTPGFQRLIPQFLGAEAKATYGQQREQGVPTSSWLAGLTSSGVSGIKVLQSQDEPEFQVTGRALDLALAPGYSLKTASGGTTTRGNLAVGYDGVLMTSAGEVLEGQSGAIKTSGEAQVWLDSTGAVFDNGKRIDQLQLQVDAGVKTPADGPIRIGVLAKSNVNIVTEMVSMIEVNKAYELCAKSVQVLDETLGKLGELIRIA